MALTQVVRLKLEGQGFDKLFKKERPRWQTMAQDARALIEGHLPEGAEPTIDDIQQILEPIMAFNPVFRAFVQKQNLTQLYWVRHFTDYILHEIYQPHLPAEE